MTSLVAFQAQGWDSIFNTLAPCDVGCQLCGPFGGLETRFHAWFIDKDNDSMGSAGMDNAVPCLWEGGMFELQLKFGGCDAFSLFAVAVAGG
jgi:hypothetical protein